jgi:hypothetical protein
MMVLYNKIGLPVPSLKRLTFIGAVFKYAPIIRYILTAGWRLPILNVGSGKRILMGLPF